MKADSFIFVLYKFGIIDSKLCGTSPLNHSVNIVGYGKNVFGKEYYIIRNSWGSFWGEFGYARIAIEEGKGICGINQKTIWPTTATN